MNTVSRWQNQEAQWPTPFGRLLTLRDQLDSLFNGNLNSWTGNQLVSVWNPAVDVHQDKENVVVNVELPGMKKEDVNVAFQDGVLTISGERKNSRTPDNVPVHRTERFEGSFQRTISLPSEIKAEAVTAEYKNGILKVTLPKAETAKPKNIEVKVS